MTSSLKDHEKFWAFLALGFSVLLLAILAIFYPLADGSGSQRILDAAMGGLLLALGGATNALFRLGTTSENAAIGQAAADAINNTTPAQVEVVNQPSDPVPTTEDKAGTDGELAEEHKL